MVSRANSSISIVQVAERAGVSVATASRVISKTNYPVSEPTRKKVLAAAAELNYSPNSLARSMKTQRSNLIAVLVGDNSDPYFAEITRGVEDVANEAGYLTIVCNTDRKPVKELHYLQTLQDLRADGIIFAGGGLQEPDYPERLQLKVNEVLRRGGAVITLSAHTLQVPSIQADSFEGARQMTMRLLELGHRRIAFIAGPSNLLVANVRLQGYMAALAEAGIPISPGLILQGNFSESDTQRAVHGLASLAPENRPTAIFAANDETAIGALLGLRKMGWKVPEDISVCGFGDLPLAQRVVPTLTTVHMDLREMGRAGMTRLIAILNGEDTLKPLVIWPTSIVERDSTSAIHV